MEESIHLVLRLRPPRYDSRVFWTAKDTKVQGEEGEYNADAVYDSRSTNQDIFKKNVHNMVEQCCVGYNTAVMAYGQSGAGKTHTLLGGGAEDGLVSYVARQLFEEVEMQQKSSGRSFLVQLQILELYCEKIRDLLVDQSSSSDRKILEANNIPQVTDLKKVPITSADQALEIIRKAQSRRVVAETELNEQSSRSHAIIQLTIESSLTTDDKSRHKCRRSVMNIVDLAGSEHVGANSGSRAKEGNNINLSLMTLTKVINQLTEKSGQSHISYRDSKLTRLLKPCLGGNSNTLIICCVDPQNKAESLRTLKFSERLKLVTARVQVNEEEEGGQLAVLMSELERLRLELADMKEKKVKEDEEEKKKRLEELSAQFFYGSDLSKPGKIRAIRRQTIAAPRMMSFGRSPPRVEARLDAHRSILKEEERTAVQAQVEAAVSTKMQDFTEQIGQLQSECANLQHRNTGLLREHDDHDQLVEANSNFVSALAELEMVVKEQSQQIQSLNESMERLSVKERKAVEKLKQQETDNARLVAFWKDQSQKANRDLRASESSCNSLKEAFDKLQLDKDAEIERLGRLLDSQKEISQADRRMHEKIKATLEDKIVEVKEESKKKALQLAAVQCDLNLARRDLEQNRTEFTSVVEKELALLRDQNSDLRVSADRLQTELEDTRLTVNRLKAELKTQTTVSDQAIKELHRVLSSQKMASASPSKEQMKREKGMERKIADLEDELEILKQKEKSWRPSIQVQNGDSEIKLARLSNKLSLMESQLDALKKEKQEADEKLQAADDNLQSKVNTLNNGIDKYNTLLAEHKMLAGKYMELKKKIGN